MRVSREWASTKSNLLTFMPPFLNLCGKCHRVKERWNGASFRTKEKTALFKMNLSPLFLTNVIARRRVLLSDGLFATESVRTN